MPPVVGAVRWVLHLPGCQSLKAKRKIVHSLKDRLRSRWEISAAETDFQDQWQKAEICAVLVSSDRRVAQSILDKMDHQMESDPRAVIVEHETVFY